MSVLQAFVIGLFVGLIIATIAVALILRWLNNNPPNFLR